MNSLSSLYRPPLALLTDLYQLTMAYAHWKTGSHRKEAGFHLYFRSNPFGGGFTVACGLARAKEFIVDFRFEGDDLDYLRTLNGSDGRPLFDEGFLEYLRFGVVSTLVTLPIVMATLWLVRSLFGD